MLNFAIVDYDGQRICDVHLFPREDYIEIHHEVYSWNKENYYIMLDHFQELKKFVKAIGKKYIGTCTKLEHKKAEKYIKMFGFNGPINIENKILFYYMEV